MEKTDFLERAYKKGPYSKVKVQKKPKEKPIKEKRKRARPLRKLKIKGVHLAIFSFKKTQAPVQIYRWVGWDCHSYRWGDLYKVKKLINQAIKIKKMKEAKK